MNYKEFICEVFRDFNKNNIDFIILRKDEIIFEKIKNEDVDILISLKDDEKVKNIFLKKKLTTYTDSKYNNIYLYKSKPHKHYYDKKICINFDVCFDISYSSINNKEFIPIDDDELELIWQNKIKIYKNNFFYYKMDRYSQLIHLICHCIFDKNQFSRYYSDQINNLLNQKIDHELLLKMLKKNFYKFADKLLELLLTKKFDTIFKNYLTFKEY